MAELVIAEKKMQAYTLLDLVNRTMLGDEMFYDCAEVDRSINAKDNRIDELERALKSCALVIKAQHAAVTQFSKAATDALIEADKALSL